MSKTSAKQRLVQLKEWLATRKTSTGSSPKGTGKPKQKFSKADFYKKTRERYGNKSN